ncbi:putative PEP-binding protein [Cellulomonas fimi]|uniref:PEP-utilizing protein n=1 Tax=Cellulomonas fimi (strain ATCC 484 / DSM 20113 / JCM 1341 / CCUG 24087 / LMG 16345 / NBRC 15513 / NCIMB 8980 / NCTC 7547 / NRS-133) TaxID=590998 RepID=F4H6E0_CELFA|nr:putative PEP-binding protein [Cellulomonas fimi]AEE44452.1 PEP-utilizing protein [Cellulomonas fimi ATCC 484]NNH06648.1 hypothetical protein [Cellulomonas fimi]VEH26391.1 phosphoenolpyruvate synthase [Cellulomonas fimi]
MTDAWLGLVSSGESVPRAVAAHLAETTIVRSEYLYRAAGAAPQTPRGAQAVRTHLRRAAAQVPGPLWYRTSDFEEREIATLDGHGPVELVENPILSRRGARRALAFPDEYLAELVTVDALSDELPDLRVLVSYVGDADEFRRLRDLAAQAGVIRPTGCMIETPAALESAHEIVSLGAERLVVGLQDLAMNFLGAHRGSVAHDRTHPGLMRRVHDLLASSPVPVVVANPASPRHAAELRDAGAARVAVTYADLAHGYGVPADALVDRHLVRQLSSRTSAELSRLATARAR